MAKQGTGTRAGAAPADLCTVANQESVRGNCFDAVGVVEEVVADGVGLVGIADDGVLSRFVPRTPPAPC